MTNQVFDKVSWDLRRTPMLRVATATNEAVSTHVHNYTVVDFYHPIDDMIADLLWRAALTSFEKGIKDGT